MKKIPTRIANSLLLSLLLSVSVLYGQDRPDALAMYRNGDYELAIEVCFQELQDLPRSRDSYTVLGWSFLALERYEEALEYGLIAIDIAPNDPRLNEILGETYYYLGNNVEALAYFERYAVIASEGARIDICYYYMGEIFIRLGEFNHADIALSTAVYHSPNSSRWWARLGYAREMAEDYPFSIEAYQRALSLNPGLTDASRGLDRVAALSNNN